MVDKIITKVKLAIKEQQIVGLQQELTREIWNWWTQQLEHFITNAQFEELQTQIAQVILENEI
ncbi:hypothetical protein G9A89_007727 [Geosiphon pyriformis]|nr:hypothetical protein G9A89_007727 [Geosiphon pyriformis]